jgi:acyl dehydratase
MKFAQFHVGQVIEAGPYTITEAEILKFASAYDPQWFHTDPEAARQGPFEGLIASGWHTCGIAMRLVAEHILRDSESFASPGVSDVRWPHPVRPGDVLNLRVTVNEVRRSAKRPELGILQWSWCLRTQEDRTVLELEGTSMFNLKSPN